MSDCIVFIARLLISTEVEYRQRCLMLVPRESAAVAAHILCTPYNHATLYSVTSFEATSCKVRLAVTCHLRFWRNDRDLCYCGNRRVERIPKKMEKKLSSRCSCGESNPQHFGHESCALTTELSPIPKGLPCQTLVVRRIYKFGK